jgi:hypothetical protein
MFSWLSYYIMNILIMKWKNHLKLIIFVEIFILKLSFKNYFPFNFKLITNWFITPLVLKII